MNEPIKVGDLVVIVRGCCDKALSQAIGVHATVIAFYENACKLCKFCGAPTPSRRAELSHPKWNAPVAWLKRIPPLDEPESEKREEEIHA